MSKSEDNLGFPKLVYRFCLFMVSLRGFQLLRLQEIASKVSLFSLHLKNQKDEGGGAF